MILVFECLCNMVMFSLGPSKWEAMEFSGR
eukprot:COSAG02_NODE_65421_length_258_cov_0.647799_1_plen_29_part_10